MALTKSVEAVDAWAEVAAGTAREGATIDVTPNYETTLHIDVSLAEATAETLGATIRVQGSTATSGDSYWEDIATLSGPTGTAISAALPAEEAAGQTVISITDPTTNNFDNNGKWKFIENATPANSELVYQTANSADAGDTITILDGLTNTQQQTTSVLWDIDSTTVSAVAQWNIEIPFTVNRVRIVYDNINVTGADIFCRARITKVTALA